MLYPFESEPVLVRKPPTLFGNMLYLSASPIIVMTRAYLARETVACFA